MMAAGLQSKTESCLTMCNALGLGLTSIVMPLVVMKVTLPSAWTACPQRSMDHDRLKGRL